MSVQILSNAGRVLHTAVNREAASAYVQSNSPHDDDGELRPSPSPAAL
jgi:hypothetical protein